MILVIVEPDRHPQEVVARATWLASITGHDLTLLLCDAAIGPLGAPFFLSNEARDIGEKIRAAQAEMIDEIASPARKSGADVTTDVLEERPISDGILHYALDTDPAFVVKGTQYHSIAERSIFVDTDWQLLRRCPCALWLVKPAGMPDKPLILAAVDPTHTHDKEGALDQIIVDTAKTIANGCDGDLHLMHTYQRLTGIGAAATNTFKPVIVPVQELEDRLRDEHKAKLDALALANGIDVNHVHQLPGSAHELIPAFARSEGAGLVVMGALARWGLKKAILGSTAERVLDHLYCDILVVRAT
jgi:universal stress protein E